MQSCPWCPMMSSFLGRAKLPYERLKRLEKHPSFASGSNWYDDAQRGIRTLAGAFTQPVNVVAGIVAVLSPRQSVAGNITLATGVLARDALVGGFHANVGKERAIHDSGDITHVRGPKVEAFYHTLVGDDALVLDSWAFRAVNLPDSPCESDRQLAVRWYTRRARACALSLSSYQAGVWCAIRHETGWRNSALLSVAVSNNLAKRGL